MLTYFLLITVILIYSTDNLFIISIIICYANLMRYNFTSAFIYFHLKKELPFDLIYLFDSKKILEIISNIFFLPSHI